MSFSSSDVDQWIADGNATSDVAGRKEIYAKIQQELVQQVPYIPFFTERKFSLVHQGWEGFATQESGYDKSMGWFGYYAVHKTN
jgi:ABC-type transport system substrate-binding protein